MLFNSYEFLFFFLPLVLGFYYLSAALGKPWLSRATLLLSSLFFYAYWDVRYLPILITSIGFNYVFGGCILRSLNKKKAWLLTGIFLNLLLLFCFKYSLFALSIFGIFSGIRVDIPQIVLPLGISFFTFTQIAFLVDAYQQKVEILTPASYGLFVTVFPHLIAGPVLHHRDMMSQFQDSKTYQWNAKNVTHGIVFFTIGLTKKVLIADQLAPLVRRVFDATELIPTFLDAWGGALAYTLQLYFDFSGYSDMAIGLGLLFNVHLPINFDSPYKAKSIIEFWRRWHITLSVFLRDYLYIPLGGNRRGSHLFNLFLTMLLGGLWHGAGWTFVLWGALQGIYLVINHVVRNRLYFPTALSWPLTLIAVIVGWVIFRSADLERAMILLQGMLGLHGLVLHETAAKLLAHWPLVDIHTALGLVGKLALTGKEWGGLIVLLIIVLTMPNSNEIQKKFQPNRITGFIAGCLFIYCILNLNKISEFLYYKF